MFSVSIVRPPFRMTAHAPIVLAATLALLTTLPLAAQDRDVRGERLVIDDNGSDGTTNTMTITAPDTLGQNVILTIPDLGVDSLEFMLVPVGTPGTWLLTGNSGTTPGTNFLGTNDATPFHLYVNGGGSNGLILNTNGSIQRDTGGLPRGTHAVDLQMVRVDSNEVASGIYSVIGGGRENLADTIASTVAGGTQNWASGYKSFIGGGDENWADGSYSVVAGGDENWALGWKNFIGGGDENETDFDYATVAGGNENIAVAFGAFIGGGEHNFVAGDDGTVAGGYGNEAYGAYSVVGGGVSNIAYGGISTIPGGAGLTLGGDGTFGYLGRNFGDRNMTILDSNIAVFGNVDLWLVNNDSTPRALRFYEAESDSGTFPSGTNYTSFRAGTQTADIDYTLPTSAPAANGRVLSSDTNGVMSWASDLAPISLLVNGATAVTNSRVVVNEGHLTSQGTAPTAAGDGTNFASSVTVDAVATDVVGTVTATDGGSVGTGVITVTFDAAYTSKPVVVITPANAITAGSAVYVSNVSGTSFDINMATTSGNGTDIYAFNYMVIEAD